MRKITSKQEEEKKRRRNQFLIGGVMILVMLASVLGYAFTKEQQGSSEKIIYNKIQFTKQSSGYWNANIGSYEFSFMYNPEETLKTSSVLNLLSSYFEKPLYIYSENSEATMEIYRNLFYQNKIVERLQDACLAGEKCENNSPVKTCEDNFIIIKESNSSEIRQENNCVFILGDAQNLTKLSDSFLFKIIGVQ
jgi:hypothetical protein